ncbi:hypothetical protein HUT00_37685, partial [Pseudomonas chlororaphis]|nr:hypothetical protein [Pseudomonas chlororaphis]
MSPQDTTQPPQKVSGSGRATIGEYLNRFAASGLIWPGALNDAELQRRMFPPLSDVPSDQRPMPDWAHVHVELRRPGVTRREHEPSPA